PLLLVFARLAQGVAAGGATAGSIVYLVEAAPRHRRGFFASFQQASQIGALLISAAIGALITNLVVAPDLTAWAWRIPFLIALVLGPVGLYIRNRLPEPEIYERAKHRAPAQPSLHKALTSNARAILTGFGMTCLWNVTAFILLFYMPTYAQRQLGLPPGDAFLSSTISSLLLFLLCPVFGLLSDRIGRKTPMLASALLLLVLIYPLFRYVELHRSFASLLAMQLVLATLIAGYTAPISAALAELFPTRTRSTGLAVAYNLSTLLFGAFGPLIVTWLIAATGNPLAPAFYVGGAAALSACVLLTVRDRSRDDLDD
ncbi:MAG: major facilitator transporter, partial [Rhodospirillales bacterium]|nr:major facilitator transporter [Rhodospirillales bacterium]